MGSQLWQVFRCGCDNCSSRKKHPDCDIHFHINLLSSRLDEQQRRWLAALLAEHYGLKQGGVRIVEQITGINQKTVRRGLKEMQEAFEGRPEEKIRLPGAGRPKSKPDQE